MEEEIGKIVDPRLDKGDANRIGMLLEELDSVRRTRERMLITLASDMLVRFPEGFRMKDIYESMAMKMLALSGVEGVASADQFMEGHLSNSKESVGKCRRCRKIGTRAGQRSTGM